jgi:exonuclease III
MLPTPPTPPQPLPSDLTPPLTVVDQYRRLFNYAHQYEVCRYHQPDRFKAKLSMTNFKANHPWGDDFALAKPPNTFRLYYQNINGIKLDDRGGDLASFLTTFSELQCDVVGLCEIKLDVSKYKVKETISSAIRHQFKSAQHAATTSPIPFETDYKPGGTMTMSFGPSVSRFQSKYEDPLGRWSTLSFNARNGMTVHFITVYQVVHKPLGGPYTAYQQQRASLLLENRDLLPRQAFLMDFEKYLQSLFPKESQFVVMGDFNEVVGRNASGFAKITSAFQLVDVLGHFHSVQTEVPTYARGTERLDYVFCSADLLPAVASCGAEPFNQHIFSDHRALFLDWHEDILFGSKCPSIVPHTQRRLVAKHRPSATKYIDELHKYSTEHNILERLGKLADNPDPLLAEKIDRDITRGMLVAESRCRHPSNDP